MPGRAARGFIPRILSSLKDEELSAGEVDEHIGQHKPGQRRPRGPAHLCREEVADQPAADGSWHIDQREEEELPHYGMPPGSEDPFRIQPVGREVGEEEGDAVVGERGLGALPCVRAVGFQPRDEEAGTKKEDDAVDEGGAHTANGILKELEEGMHLPTAQRGEDGTEIVLAQETEEFAHGMCGEAAVGQGGRIASALS